MGLFNLFKMKNTVHHNEVYYWVIGDNNAYALLKILNQLKLDTSSDWFYGHSQPMSKWPVINLS